MKLRALCLSALLLAAPAVAREPAPAPHCIDGRDIRESWQSDDTTLALLLGDGSRYRIELADPCPQANAGGQPQLLSRAGWLCGSNDELIRAGGRHCALAGLTRIDAREFAGHAQAARRLDQARTLDTVVVTGPRPRRFLGTASHCLNTRYMRAWHEDADGLVVAVSPRHSGGHRHYRVELAGACPDPGFSQHLRLGSRLGTRLICGNPGDYALFGDGPATGALQERPGSDGLARASRALTGGRACLVTRVYPLTQP